MQRWGAAPWLTREGGGFVALLIFVLVLLSLLPTVRLIAAALAPGGAWNPYGALAEISSPSALAATWHTVETSLLSAVGALVVGATFAVTLAISDVRGKRVLAFLFVLSLMIAPQVAAVAFKSLAGPSSPLLQAVSLAPAAGSPNVMIGRDGIILVLALHHAPLVAVTLVAGLRAIPRSVIEAALIDGANPLNVVLRIVLPLLRPHLASAALLAFVAAVGNFGIPALLGIPANYMTLPTLIYRRLSSFGPSGLPDAVALSLLVALIAGAGVLAGAIVLRRAPAPLEPEEAMKPFWRTGSWRPAVEGTSWVLIAVSLVLPLASLIATSLVPAYGVPLTLDTVTVSNFAEVLLRQEVTTRAFRTSLLLSGTAAVLTATLAVGIAYGLERYAGRGGRLAESLLEIPYALPGVVLAIACILLFLKPLPVLGISLYATPYIILFAYLARFQALALKAPLAAMAVLARDQEEAAALDGASAFERLRFVVLPQLLPAAVAGGLLVFLIALNELTVSALLWTAGTETLGVALLSLEEAGLAPAAAALAVSAVVVVVGIMLILDRLARSLPDHVLPWTALEPAATKPDRAATSRWNWPRGVLRMLRQTAQIPAEQTPWRKSFITSSAASASKASPAARVTSTGP